MRIRAAAWDFSHAPELRESLIDLLADAIVAYVERTEAGAEAATGKTPPVGDLTV